MTTARVVLAALTSAIGAMASIGCLIAIKFELDGFGRERDTPIRSGYMAVLIAGLLASILIPTAITMWAVPGKARRWVLLGGIVGIIVLLSILGIWW